MLRTPVHLPNWGMRKLQLTLCRLCSFMMRARMVSSLTLSHLSAFARGKRGVFRIVSVGDQSAGCETEGKSCSHYKTEYFICRCPHYASLIFLQLSGIMSCLKSIKQGQSTPPPKKQSSIEFYLLVALRKTSATKNAKRSRERISPDAKRSTGIIAPPPMQQEKHAGNGPPHAARRSTLGQFRHPIQQESRTLAALVWFV